MDTDAETKRRGRQYGAGTLQHLCIAARRNIRPMRTRRTATATTRSLTVTSLEHLATALRWHQPASARESKSESTDADGRIRCRNSDVAETPKPVTYANEFTRTTRRPTVQIDASSDYRVDSQHSRRSEGQECRGSGPGAPANRVDTVTEK